MTPHITHGNPSADPPDRETSSDSWTEDDECQMCPARGGRDGGCVRGERWPALEGSTAERVLRLAELIVARSEFGIWRRSDYPTRDQMAAELNAAPLDLCAAVNLLTWRRLLFPQHDPQRGTRQLPTPDLTTRTAAAQVADKIALRIRLGLWAGSDFPTIETIAAALVSSLKTVTAAMQILKSEGLMHKIVIDSGVKGRGSRRQVWRPTDVADQGVRDLAPVLREAIATGELGPILPAKAEVAERYRVPGGLVADAYQQLRQEGLIGIGWVSRRRNPVWFVIGAEGPPEGVLPGEVRSIAVAARIVKDLPEWLMVHRDGTWFRRALPTQRDLMSRYRVHAFEVERGVELLVRLRILERAPVVNRLYFPLPPTNRDTEHGPVFRVIGRPPPRPWVPTRDTVDWLPLPTSADDDNVRFVDGLEPRLARKRNNAQPEGSA